MTQAEEHKNVFENVPRVDLSTMDIDRDTAMILSETICCKIQGICIGKTDPDMISVVVKDPTQIYIYDQINYDTHNKYRATLLQGDPKMIDLAIEFVYRIPEGAQGAKWTEWLESKKFVGQALNLVTTGTGEETDAKITGTVIDRANRIISEAISIGASDIHLEMFEKQLIIRFRIDGVLHVVDVVENMGQAQALIHRIKIMANMDISQDRVTQDGRISVQIADQNYDLRVSIVPVPNGESIVMRLLNKSAFNLKLQTLGFNDDQLNAYQRMVSHPFGIILVSGPTGSGKSTTLYASLKEINRPDRKLLTVEDPIEYDMPGIVQVQVNLSPKEEEKKVTFSKALREFLRQDPDVILVGEIRDDETAKISIQAAQTGHLVLSTIHTNDAVGVVNRLKDMNVMPYLIASTLIGAVAQRLVRRICPDCRQSVENPPDDIMNLVKILGIQNPTFYQAGHCSNCRRTGYRGRVGLFEIMLVSDAIRDKIEVQATAGEIFRTAKEEGMKTLLADGILKAAQGMTSIDEVRRVCMMDIKV